MADTIPDLVARLVSVYSAGADKMQLQATADNIHAVRYYLEDSLSSRTQTTDMRVYKELHSFKAVAGEDIPKDSLVYMDDAGLVHKMPAVPIPFDIYTRLAGMVEYDYLAGSEVTVVMQGIVSSRVVIGQLPGEWHILDSSSGILSSFTHSFPSFGAMQPSWMFALSPSTAYSDIPVGGGTIMKDSRWSLGTNLGGGKMFFKLSQLGYAEVSIPL